MLGATQVVVGARLELHMQMRHNASHVTQSSNQVSSHAQETRACTAIVYACYRVRLRTLLQVYMQVLLLHQSTVSTPATTWCFLRFNIQH